VISEHQAARQPRAEHHVVIGARRKILPSTLEQDEAGCKACSCVCSCSWLARKQLQQPSCQRPRFPPDSITPKCERFSPMSRASIRMSCGVNGRGEGPLAAFNERNNQYHTLHNAGGYLRSHAESSCGDIIIATCYTKISVDFATGSVSGLTAMDNSSHWMKLGSCQFLKLCP